MLGIRALHLTHPKCTHTAVNTHTHTPSTHTRSSAEQPFMLRRPGNSCGFGALFKGTSVVVLKVERALNIHSPHLQFLPARDSNSQPLGYESDSLTIRPRLPIVLCCIISLCFSCTDSDSVSGLSGRSSGACAELCSTQTLRQRGWTQHGLPAGSTVLPGGEAIQLFCCFNILSY